MLSSVVAGRGAAACAVLAAVRGARVRSTPHHRLAPSAATQHFPSSAGRRFCTRARAALEPPDVTRLAETARISLSSSEVEEFAPKIRQVVDWFGQLQAVNLENIDPALRADTGDNVNPREDVPETFENREAMLAAVPSYEDPYIKLGVLLDRRIWQYFFPVLSFVLIYSKLAHKELRFIVSAIPMFNLCASIAASRIYNNRRKSMWSWIYIIMLGAFLVSLGCSAVTFMASFDNYPSANAQKTLHQIGNNSNDTSDRWVHIDNFAAMNGISRFCEHNPPWRFSKDEGIDASEYQHRNFTYLLNEHPKIEGYRCLFAEYGFSRAHYKIGFPPIQLYKEPKVFVHGNMQKQKITLMDWPGCP